MHRVDRGRAAAGPGTRCRPGWPETAIRSAGGTPVPLRQASWRKHAAPASGTHNPARRPHSLIRSSLRPGDRALCARRSARAIAVTLGSLFVFLALLAGTVAGVEGPTSLANPSVSPRSGSPTTSVSSAVEYRNREGSAPAYVRVMIDGQRHSMRASGPLSYKSGVRFAYRTTLPAGTHRISFQAADTRRFTTSVAGGTVRIQAATSNPGSGTGGSGGSGAGGWTSGGSAGSGAGNTSGGSSRW